MAVMSPETHYLYFLKANVTQPFAIMLHAKVQITAVDIEYNYVIVTAQNNEFFFGDLDPITGINSNHIKITVFWLTVSFAVTENL